MRWGWVLATGLMVAGLTPVLSLGVGTVIATLGDCRVRDGYAGPCMIGGRDWAGVLSTLDTLGWFFFLTAPVALAGFVLGIVLAVLSLMHRARD